MDDTNMAPAPISWCLDNHGNKVERIASVEQDGTRTASNILRVTLSGRTTRTRAQVVAWYWDYAGVPQPGMPFEVRS